MGLGDNVGGRDWRDDDARDTAGGSGKRVSGAGGTPTTMPNELVSFETRRDRVTYLGHTVL